MRKWLLSAQTYEGGKPMFYVDPHMLTYLGLVARVYTTGMSLRGVAVGYTMRSG